MLERRELLTNSPPVVDDQSFGLPENSASATVVGTVVASDADLDTLSYAIASGNTNGAFAIDAATGEITVANPAELNFETTPTFLLSVDVSDGTETDSAVITINLSNVNEAPTVLAQSFSLPENSAVGTVVGTVTASDPDAGDVLTYSINSENPAGAFAVDATTGQITVANSLLLNLEANGYPYLHVRATDQSGASTTGLITVPLSNVNETPLVRSLNLNVYENRSNGTYLSTMSVNFPEAGETLNWEIIGGNEAGGFSLDPTTAQLTIANGAVLNFEVTPVFVLTVRATDPTGLSGTGTATINLLNVNEAPVVPAVTFSLPENSANGTVVGTVSAVDPDAGAVVTYSITSGVPSGAFAVNASTGQVTVANSALLNFEATPAPYFFLKGTDQFGAYTINRIDVNLTNVNDAPVVTPATISRNENMTNGNSVWAMGSSDQDVGDTRTWAITGGNVGGTFAINATTGVITVANSATMNYEVTPTFALTIQATDTGGLTGSAVLTINLVNVNEAPVVSPGTFSLPENSANGTIVGNVPAVDPDAGAVLTYTITSASPAGAFAVNATTGQITVANSALLNFETTPAPFFFVRATDQFGLSSTNRMTINLTNVQEAPTVTPRTYSIAENSANFTTVGTYSATDPEGGTFTWSIVGGNVGGAFALQTLTAPIIYVANSAALDFETTPTFSLILQAVDSTGLAGTGLYTINLTNVNEAPIVSAATFSLPENSAIGTVVGTVPAVDPDAGAVVTYSILAGTLNGGFAINANTGELTVTNSTLQNFEVSPSFSFLVAATDQFGLSTTNTVTVNLTNVQEAPTVTPQTYTIAENSPNGTTVGLLSATDPEGGPFTWSILSGNVGGAFSVVASPAGFVIQVADTAALDFEATPTFSLVLQAVDSTDLAGTGTYTINLTNVDEAPTANAASFSTDEDTSLSGTLTGSDVEGSAISFALVTGPSNGSLTLNADGSFSYLPNANFNGSDSFTFKTNDGSLDSAPATVSLSIAAINDAPTANGVSLSTDEDTTLNGTLTGSDIEGSALTFSVVSGPANGSLTLNADGSFSYSPNANFNGSDSFTFKTNDGALDSAAATVSLSIAAVNDAPIANATSFSGTEDTTLNGTLTGSDVEGSALTFSVVSGPANGSLTLNSNGSFSYSPNANFNGSDSFTFKTNDGARDSASATVSLSIAAVNDAPIANATSFSGTEDTTLNGTLTGSDIEGSALTFLVVTGPANGSLTLNANGSFSFSPNANFNGSTSFTFKTNDGELDSVAATVSLSIAAVNDAPTLSPATFSLPENSANGTSVGTVSANDPDVGDTKSFVILSGNTGGAFAINAATGAITVANTAMLDFETTPSFTLSVRVTDGGGLTSTANVTINLTDVVETKFFTVDPGTDAAYRYSASGTAQPSSALASGNTNSMGVASDITGAKYWVIDSNKSVYIYNAATGALLGSWSASGLTTPQGITTDGTHIWIIDSGSDKVFKYDNAASRLSGTQAANSSWSLNNSNKNSTDLVTNGTHIWTLESANNDKVFKYTTAGALVGSWTISATNATPTGLTINPANVSDIWIVDSGTDKVYQYTAAATRISGSQAFAASFNLAAANTNAQGIADPPPAGTHTPTSASEPLAVSQRHDSSSSSKSVTIEPAPALATELPTASSSPNPASNSGTTSESESLPTKKNRHADAEAVWSLFSDDSWLINLE